MFELKVHLGVLVVILFGAFFQYVFEDNNRERLKFTEIPIVSIVVFFVAEFFLWGIYLTLWLFGIV